MQQQRPAEPAVRARLFGELRLAVSDRVITARDLNGIKPKQLLELLLLERGRVVPKDRIADALWGESPPISIGATIETYVSIIRRALGSSRNAIRTVHGGYRLDPTEFALDVDEFDQHLQAAASAEPPDRLLHLTAAVELGREPLLSDEPYSDWVEPVRRKYSDRHALATIELAECCAQLGRQAEAEALVTDALAKDPVSERAARLLMVIRYSTGDLAGAMAVYGELRALLARELAVTPAPDTVRLHAAMRDGVPATMLVAAAASRPRIRFATSGSTRLAYESFGSGEHHLLFVPQFLTNLAATWDEPVYATFLQRLGTLARTTLFDKRGSGLSDPVFEWPTADERAEDIGAVLDAAGVRRTVLFGVCDGGVTCIRFAARHPERVAALVLFGTPVRLLACEGFEIGWSSQFYRGFLHGFDSAWTSGAGLEAMDPSIASDARYRYLFSRFLRLGTSPGLARQLWEREGPELDVRDLLPEVTAPCLVMTRHDDPWVAPENSRYLAEHLIHAGLVELTGRDHEPWLGDADPVIDALGDFIRALDPVEVVSA